MDYSSSIKMYKLLIYATTQVVMLNERTQSQKTTYYMYYINEIVEKNKL